MIETELQNHVIGVLTGINSIDMCMHGLRGFVGFAGAPKSCKSTLVLQIALYNAMNNVGVIYIDIENGYLLMLKRAICSFKGISWSTFTRLDADKRNAIIDSIRKLPFYLCSKAIPSKVLDELLAQCFKRHEKVLLVIDSLHKLPQTSDNIRASIDTWLLYLDEQKLKYNPNLTILVTSEKRRGTYDVAAQDGAKESGRIEYTLEQLFNMRNQDEQIIIECLYNRHGVQNASWVLYKKYENSKHDSFIFRLEERIVKL